MANMLVNGMRTNTGLSKVVVRYVSILGILMLSGSLFSSGIGSTYEAISGIVLLGLFVILALSLLADVLCNKLKFPSVLGELFIGIVLGNLGAFLGWDLMILLREGSEVTNLIHGMLGGTAEHIGSESNPHVFEILSGHSGHSYAFAAQVIEAISFLGAIALLFVVGLENSPREITKNGKRATIVAIIGVFVPLLGVWAMCALSTLFIGSLGEPVTNWKLHMFIGAVLTATSVGITAKIFKDAGKIESSESKLILGAAVIDDILAISLLAIIMGLVNELSDPFMGALFLVVKSLVFIGVVFFVGPRVAGWGTSLFSKMSGAGGKEIYALSMCFILAWFAEFIGLAAIVGAFLAGLILSDGKGDSAGENNEEHTYQSLLEPVQVFLTPVFFIIIGMQVKLESLFTNYDIIILALFISVAAWYGKRVSGYFSGPKCDSVVVGLGMIPRGEVGLIFAALGKQAGVIDESVMAMLVLIIIITTFLAPVMLTRKLAKT